MGRRTAVEQREAAEVRDADKFLVSIEDIGSNFHIVSKSGGGVVAEGHYWNCGHTNVAVAISFNRGGAGMGHIDEFAAYLGASSTQRYDRSDPAMLDAAANGVKLTETEARAILGVRHGIGSAADILAGLAYRR